MVELTGGSSDDAIDEVVESANDKVFARVRVAGRESDYEGKWTVIEDPAKLGKIAISSVPLASNDFYRSLNPITDWNVDIDKAIRNARRRGAKAIPPDKFGMDGGPGTFRLLNIRTVNLNGSYWRIPYLAGIRPVLVSADTGVVYALNNRGEYARSWEDYFRLER